MVKSVVEGFDYSAVTTIHKTDDSSRLFSVQMETGYFN